MFAHFVEMYKEYKAILNKPTFPHRGIIGAATYVLSGRADIMNYIPTTDEYWYLDLPPLFYANIRKKEHTGNLIRR